MSIVLSENMFQVISEICTIPEQINLKRVNKKFKKVIENYSMFELFHLNIEILHRKGENFWKAYDTKNKCDSTLIELKNCLGKLKYSRSQVKHFLTELVKNYIRK